MNVSGFALRKSFSWQVERERSLFMKMWGGEGGNVKEKKRTLMRYSFSMKNNKG